MRLAFDYPDSDSYLIVRTPPPLMRFVFFPLLKGWSYEAMSSIWTNLWLESVFYQSKTVTLHRR